jgi:hypothetical protein
LLVKGNFDIIKIKIKKLKKGKLLFHIAHNSAVYIFEIVLFRI